MIFLKIFTRSFHLKRHLYEQNLTCNKIKMSKSIWKFLNSFLISNLKNCLTLILLDAWIYIKPKWKARTLEGLWWIVKRLQKLRFDIWWFELKLEWFQIRNFLRFLTLIQRIIQDLRLKSFFQKFNFIHRLLWRLYKYTLIQNSHFIFK